MSKDTIKISGIKAFGFHGVFEEERKSGQDFIADIEFTYKTEKAIKSDDLAHAIDYGSIATLVKILDHLNVSLEDFFKSKND